MELAVLAFMGVIIAAGLSGTVVGFRRRAKRRAKRLYILQRIAARHGGTFEPLGWRGKNVQRVGGGLWLHITGQVLTIEVDGVLIRVETFSTEGGDGLGTRLVARKTINGGPTFVIWRRGLLSRKKHSIGDEAFDEVFCTNTLDKGPLLEILDAELRHALVANFRNWQIRGDSTLISMTVDGAFVDQELFDLAISTLVRLASEPATNMETLSSIEDGTYIPGNRDWDGYTHPCLFFDHRVPVNITSAFDGESFGVLATATLQREVPSFECTSLDDRSIPEGALGPEAATIVDGIGQFQLICDEEFVYIFLEGNPKVEPILNSAKLAELVAVGESSRRH